MLGVQSCIVEYKTKKVDMGKYYGGVGGKGMWYSQHFFVIIQVLHNSNFKKQNERDLSTRKMNRDFPGGPVT